jgi:hypothetical protein
MQITLATPIVKNETVSQVELIELTFYPERKEVSVLLSAESDRRILWSGDAYKEIGSVTLDEVKARIAEVVAA